MMARLKKQNTRGPRTAHENLLTLPDYLRPGLKLVFIGLNPGLYSARQGKYFARLTNRLWPALSASKFFGMKVQAGDERMLIEKGVGFTDVVKRASGQIDELSRAEIIAGAKALRRKLSRYAPQAACFIGLTGYRWLFDIPARTKVTIGPQDEMIGETLLYVLPSTSPANAHFSFDEIVAAFRGCKKWLTTKSIVFDI
jgi:TDG/mug DNA glycosylase family protein